MLKAFVVGACVIGCASAAWAAEGDPVDVGRLDSNASMMMPAAQGPEAPLGRVANGRNESPEEVRALLNDLQDQKMLSDVLEPRRAKLVDQRIAAMQVRLAIAEMRRERDRLKKKKGKREQAAKLDIEIGKLKEKLEELEPAKPQRSWWQNVFAREDEEI